MKNSQLKFSYIPQYTDLAYIGVFLIGISIIEFEKFPFWVSFFVACVIICICFFIQRKPLLFLFENHFELHYGVLFNKTIVKREYSDILKIEYCFAEIRGSHLFKIAFKSQNNEISMLQYSFRGRPSKVEVEFLKSKKVEIAVKPESAKYKLPK